jgi:Trm5-related predicted tRNA methylase
MNDLHGSERLLESQHGNPSSVVANTQSNVSSDFTRLSKAEKRQLKHQKLKELRKIKSQKARERKKVRLAEERSVEVCQDATHCEDSTDADTAVPLNTDGSKIQTSARAARALELLRRQQQLRNALIHGLNVCIDLSYENIHSDRELSSLARQLANSYGYLKKLENCPIHLHLCGLPVLIGERANNALEASLCSESSEALTEKKEDHISDNTVSSSLSPSLYNNPQAKSNKVVLYEKLLQQGIKSWVVEKHHELPWEIDFFPFLPSSVTSSSSSPLSLPSLVMLSPDADEPLEEFDPNKIYIIGGIVDRTVNKSRTLQKSKELEIEVKRLPIQEYLPNRTNHILNIDHMIEIICSYLATKVPCSYCWVSAFSQLIPLSFCLLLPSLCIFRIELERSA